MALLWPAFGPDLANRSGPHKCHHSTLHVAQIIIPHVPRCVPDLGRQYVAIWVVTSLSTTFQQLRACSSDTVVFKDCFITGPVKGRENANKINQMLRPMAREGRNKNGDTQESANNIQNLLTK